jgi:dTDP-4-dehydrorhamnose reductase
MTLLLFGRSGQLGGELLRLGAPDGVELVALGRDAVDLAVPGAAAAAIGRVRPTVIVNAMAYTMVDEAERQPARAVRVNRDAPAEMAAAAAEIGAVLIHVSIRLARSMSMASPSWPASGRSGPRCRVI